jgi:heme/copper-type cytochrome/quinol oxidase subunit 2
MRELVSRLIRTLPVVLALALLLALADAALACPTCKENLAGDPEAANIVRGYFYSILFMLSMPPLILSGLSLYFYYEIRKARALQAKAAAEGHLEGNDALDGRLIQA